MRAYCYPSGLIEFGTSVPKGARIIARGMAKPLRDYITVKARHAKRGASPSQQALLVPGVPEANSEIEATAALKRWSDWIAIGAPKFVRVLPL